MSRIARALRTATQVDPRATFPAVDASGAYDHVSRAAMLGPASTGGVALPLLPYGSQFYAIQSVYTWVDAHQRNHDILHCEGAEQGDPLMPGYSVAKRFSARSRQACAKVKLCFAYLNDIYIVALPERIRELCSAVEDALTRCGTTRVSNSM